MAAPSRSEDSKAFKKIQFQFGSFKLRYAWVSQRGYYPEDLDKANQDQHDEAENFGADLGITDCAFFGVYDGHGKTGDKCAIFARDYMRPTFADCLAKVRLHGACSVSGAQPKHTHTEGTFVPREVGAGAHCLRDC